MRHSFFVVTCRKMWYYISYNRIIVGCIKKWGVDMEKNDNCIYIQMLGEFSIRRGERTLNSESNRSKKVMNLIEFLVANRNATVSQEKLIESVWDGEEFDNPLNTLKNMAYRARNILKSLWAEDEQIVDLIKFEGNTYVWNNSVPCVVDIEEMEKLSKEVEKEQFGKEEKLTRLYTIFELYKGEFLPKSSFYEWVIHLNAYYHSLFSKNTKLLLGMLKEEERYEDVATICEKYNRFYSYDEDVHVKLLEAYAKTSRLNEAVSHYNFIEELFFEEFGVGLSEETVKFYRELSKSAHNVEYDICNIQSDLIEAATERGAFFCDYDIFKNIYRLQSRMLQRNGASVFFALFTIVDVRGDMPDKEVIKKTITLLKNIMVDSLRMSDVVSKYSTLQLVALLPYTSYENGQKVCARIEEQFKNKNKNSKIKLVSRLQAIEPVEM